MTAKAMYSAGNPRRSLARLLLPAAMAWLCFAIGVLSWELRPRMLALEVDFLMLLMLVWGVVSVCRIPGILDADRSTPVRAAATIAALTPGVYVVACVLLELN